MSDTSHAAAVTRFDSETWGTTCRIPEIRHALANGAAVDFVMLDGDADVLFTLRPVRGAVQVVGRGGHHVGIYADVGTAVQAGWGSPWWNPEGDRPAEGTGR